MMSQSHLLLASGLLAKPGENLRNAALIVGAFLPDAAIYVLFFWSKLAGIAESRVWNELYWQEPWQSFTAAGNSIFLYGGLLVLGVFALRSASSFFRIGIVLVFLALAALSHIATDLPVHVEDAHRHFWPVSDWKFISPVSYWNPDHHGRVFMFFELILGAVLCIILFRRFKSWPVRLLLLVLLAAYVAVPVYFTLSMPSGPAGA